MDTRARSNAAASPFLSLSSFTGERERRGGARCPRFGEPEGVKFFFFFPLSLWPASLFFLRHLSFSLSCLLATTCAAPLSCSSSSPSCWRQGPLLRCSVGVGVEQREARKRLKEKRMRTNAKEAAFFLSDDDGAFLPRRHASRSLSHTLSLLSLHSSHQQGATRPWMAPPTTPPSTKRPSSPSRR